MNVAGRLRLQAIARRIGVLGISPRGDDFATAEIERHFAARIHTQHPPDGWVT